MFVLQLDTQNPLRNANLNAPTLGLNATVSKTKDAPLAIRSLQLSPNPATDATILLVESPSDLAAEIKILDVAGRQLNPTQHQLQSGRNAIRLDIATLKAGIYFVQLNTSAGTQTIKLVKSE